MRGKLNFIEQVSRWGFSRLPTVLVVACSSGLQPPGPGTASSSTQGFALGGSPDPTYIAADADNVYWIDLGGTIYAASVAGGSQRILAMNQVSPMHIATSRGDVFWVNEGSGEINDAGVATSGPKEVMKWSPGADGPTAIFGMPYGYPAGLVVTPEQIVLAMIYTNQGEIAATGEIISIPRDGSAPTVLASDQPYTAGVTSDGSLVYWTNAGMPVLDDAGTPVLDPTTGWPMHHGGGALHSLPLGGGDVTSLASAEFTYYAAPAVGSMLYVPYTDGQTYTLLQCPLAGCSDDNSKGTVLLTGASGTSVPSQLVNDGDHLYYSLSDDATPSVNAKGRVMKLVPGQKPVALASDIAVPCGVVLNDTYVFWTDGCSAGYGASGGTVWRLPK